MKRMILTDRTDGPHGSAARIVCPILNGLTAGQADCSIVMPIGNANESLLAALDRVRPAGARVNLHAGVLCADPFVDSRKFLATLKSKGARGVVNWPTSIFFEARTRNAMAAIPATPQKEYQWLAQAIEAGLDASAFVLSRDQGLLALDTGIERLIVHPGLPHSLEPGSEEPLVASLAQLLADLRKARANVELFVYRHPSMPAQLAYEKIGADGVVDYGVST